MQTEEISRPNDEPPEPTPIRRIAWLRLFSARSVQLVVLAALFLGVGLAAAIEDWAADHPVVTLELAVLATGAGIAALLSLAVDMARVHRLAGLAFWRGYRTGFSDMLDARAGREPGELIDLDAERRNRRPARAAPPMAAPGDHRRRVAVLAVVVPLLLAGVGMGLLQMIDQSDDPDSPNAAWPGVAIVPQPTHSAPPGATAAPTVSATGTGRSSASGVPTSVAASAGQRSSSAASVGPISDGTYRVGTDIAAGTWSSGGAVNLTLGCWYQVNRAQPTKAPLYVGPVAVQLRAGDSFATGGCKPWRRAG